MQSELRIVVDADACPVKQEIIDIARQYTAHVLMVASIDHQLVVQDGVQTIQVDRGDQSVDLFISNCLLPKDVLITQDFGLAAIGLAKQAVVISNRGQQYSNETIDYLLARRHELARSRRGGKRTKGPKAMTVEDRRRFQQRLTKVLRQLQDS